MKQTSLLDVVTLACALGCGLVAGLFFAFSTAVMRSLGRLPAEQGIAAMQGINVVILNPWFLVVFFGTAAACVFTLIAALTRWHAPASSYLLVGSVLYLIGTIMVTMLFNVPRNNALAAVQPGTDQGAVLWAGYLTGWTAWNHVRTVAALAAAGAFSLALKVT